MRQLWFQFTYGKKEPTKPASGGSKPEFIPVEGPAYRLQNWYATCRGIKVTRNLCSNGYSSVVALTLQSDAVHNNLLDFLVLSSRGTLERIEDLSPIE